MTSIYELVNEVNIHCGILFSCSKKENLVIDSNTDELEEHSAQRIPLYT